MDVVTLEPPASDTRLAKQIVKRVWALPGERIELREGEAWIAGQLLQKSVSELAQVCVPLSSFPAETQSHWWVSQVESGRRTRAEQWAKNGVIEWSSEEQLEYRYVRPTRDPHAKELRPSSIVDDYPVNQNSPAPLHVVGDFLLAVEWLETPPHRCWIHLKYGNRLYTLGVADGDAGPSELPQIAGSKRLVVAICDGRLLASSGRDEKQWDLNTLNSKVMNEDTNIIITTGGNAKVRCLAVARDVWLGPRESRAAESTADLGIEGYFVLGDNLPLSIDSRDASLGRISAASIRGRVAESDRSEDWTDWLFRSKFRCEQPR